MLTGLSGLPKLFLQSSQIVSSTATNDVHTKFLMTALVRPLEVSKDECISFCGVCVCVCITLLTLHGFDSMCFHCQN